MIRAAIAIALVIALGTGAYLLGRAPQRPDIQARVAVSEALGDQGANDTGFARAMEPRAFAFPADHGPHAEFKVEWWYYTGNLDAADGRHFGYQLTFFRVALTPEAAQRSSSWGMSQVYMGHFALSDAGGERFFSFERTTRAAAGLAGAQASPFRVWLEDWSAEGDADDALPMRLCAAQDGVSLDLTLQSAKPVVLQGEAGLSQKSAEPGNASYYYSLTRMPSAGTIVVDGERFEVSGLSWMDREWSTSALGADQVGWDWFSLQLSDGSELMLYQMRLRSGGSDPFSSGTVISPDGKTRRLTRDEFAIEVLDRWSSPRSGATYPARWRLRIPAEQIELEVAPHQPDQELDVSVQYWEGAVRLSGSTAGQPVTGHGYVELTGYVDQGAGRQ